ncbi:T9SS type A sorting domain-containing protein [Pseudochryseolinea flava]|uniref:Secretion system C-terminal sorting domain-containing protein n=1 Tax=Pseudochryseolinea flava TaxID=2059302 RepID=A0A364XVX1_9BACT|nr:T9SS type A sorting domain-containing protein [Pseudochryseolinea flava]RAV97872.1 hypothetical protein DQQ10_26305 [Pseudochryseolinea flava]
MRKQLLGKLFTLLVALCVLPDKVFSQSENYVDWQINTSDLSGGKVVMNVGQTRTITYTVTAGRNLNPTGGPGEFLPVNFQFQLFRMPSGFSTCGCTPISNIETITSADFAANENMVTKQYTVSVTAGAGTSTSGSTLRSNDKIILTVAGPWAPNKSFTVTVNTPPLDNNSISNSGATSFPDTGNPAVLNGSTPTGGNGTFTYQWQSSLGTPNTFLNIAGATGKNYDPPAIQFTTYYRRVVTSSALTSTSNTIAVSIVRTGSTMNNPINIGDFSICSTYYNEARNFPEYGYGNEYGNSTDDVFYRFNLTEPAHISLANCKTDGVTGLIDLLDASGNLVAGGTLLNTCDVGYEQVFNVQPGVYYIVSESNGPNSTNYLPVYLQAYPIFTTSASNVTIVSGTSTTLQAFGSGVTYTWSPSTGLSSTTGASVIASPAFTTTYNVKATTAEGCYLFKMITVNVTGSPGSTFNSPRVVTLNGCSPYYSGPINPAGYGNEYGGPSEDLYFKFTLASSSQVSIWTDLAQNNMRLVLLNSAGAFMEEQLYSWEEDYEHDSGYHLVLVDGTPMKPTLPAGTYYVVAEGNNGSTPFSVSIQKTTACREATDISHEKLNEEVPVKSYPNPAKEEITVFFNQDGPADIHFVSVSGVEIKRVSTSSGNSATINIHDVPQGLYLLRIHQGNTLRTEKLLIEK